MTFSCASVPTAGVHFAKINFFVFPAFALLIFANHNVVSHHQLFIFFQSSRLTTFLDLLESSLHRQTLSTPYCSES